MDQPQKTRRPGTFQPGNPGRRKGSKNKLPKDLTREALAAAKDLGGKQGARGYLKSNKPLLDKLLVEAMPSRAKPATDADGNPVAESVFAPVSITVIGVPCGAQFDSTTNQLVYPGGDIVNPVPHQGFIPSPDPPASDPVERVQQLSERLALFEARNAYLEHLHDPRLPMPTPLPIVGPKLVVDNVDVEADEDSLDREPPAA